MNGNRRGRSPERVGVLKPKFHVSSLLVANVMKKLATCHEKLGRVGRIASVLRGRYEKTVPVEFRLNPVGVT